MKSLSDFENTNQTERDGPTESLYVSDLEYHIESKGARRDHPVVTLFCRDRGGHRREIAVTGVRPYFYIRESDYETHESDLASENLVINCYRYDDNDERFRTIDDEPLVRIVCGVPDDVATLRDHCHDEWDIETFQADVFFTNVFLLESGIRRGVRVPAGVDRVPAEQIEPLEVDEVPDVLPRLVTIDIEVAIEGDGFPSIDDAEKPITAITAHDSRLDRYRSWVLAHDSWTNADRESVIELESERGCAIEIYDDESELLGDFVTWVVQLQPDLVSGWNSNNFDYPYLINRCYNRSVYEIQQLSPFEECFVAGGDHNPTPVITGMVTFDMLEAYRKTQIHDLKSYSLDYVAERELGAGKETMDDIDAAWAGQPKKFVSYNIRDVEAVVGIEREQEVLELFDNLRRFTGVQFGEAHNNINIIDILLLRRARDQSKALPTSTEPEEDWFHGAFVVQPTAGLSENVVYPDLVGLYPNTIWATNLSPETLIGSVEDLESSDYDESDCYTVYVDPRPVKRCEHGADWQQYKDTGYKAIRQKKKSGSSSVTRWVDEPQLEDRYVLKPSVEESFIRGAVDDALELKNIYKGTEKYDAVKRICNSYYGVLGDANSYGSGYRLFDHEIAEAITLAGRRVLKQTMDGFIAELDDRGYHDATIVGGDTDSVTSEVPSAETLSEVKEAAMDAASAVNDSYDNLVVDAFGFAEEDPHRFEVEIESIATRLFYPRDQDFDDPTVGKKKRYAQHIVWDDDVNTDRPNANESEGTWYLLDDELDEWGVEINTDQHEPTPPEDRIGVKGFDLVRSDTADITAEMQRHVFKRILTEDDPKEPVYEYLQKYTNSILRGDIPLEDLGIPSAIGQSLSEYGTPNRKCQPQYRGAKYVNQMEIDDLSSGDKPLLYYVTSVADGYDETYTAETAEDDGEVDAITVSHPNRIPDGFEIDYERMAEKIVRDPIEPILETMGWGFDDVMGDGIQDRFGDVDGATPTMVKPERTNDPDAGEQSGLADF